MGGEERVMTFFDDPGNSHVVHICVSGQICVLHCDFVNCQSKVTGITSS